MKGEEEVQRDYHPLYRMWCSIFFSTFLRDPSLAKKTESTKKQDKTHHDSHIVLISKLCADGRINNEGLKTMFASEAYDSVIQQLTDGILIIRDEKQKCYKLNPRFLSEVDIVLSKIIEETDAEMKENIKTMEQSKDSVGASKRCKECKKPVNIQYTKAIARMRCDRCGSDEFDDLDEDPDRIRLDIERCRIRLVRLERFVSARKKIQQALQKRRNDQAKGLIQRKHQEQRQMEFDTIMSKIDVDRNVSEEEKAEIERLLADRPVSNRLPFAPRREKDSWVSRLAELNRQRSSVSNPTTVTHQ